MDEITISVQEYKRLLECEVRIFVFADYVNKSKYSIDRKECGSFLNFGVMSHDEN